MLVRRDLVASVALGDVVELVTVVDHAGLRGGGRRDAVGGLGGCGSRRGVIIENADTGVGISLQASAVLADLGVPSSKLFLRDLLVRGDLTATVVLGDVVELLAVADHTRLCWLRSFNTNSNYVRN